VSAMLGFFLSLLFTEIYTLSVKTFVGWLMIFLVENVNLRISFFGCYNSNTVSANVDTMSTLPCDLLV